MPNSAALPVWAMPPAIPTSNAMYPAMMTAGPMYATMPMGFAMPSAELLATLPPPGLGSAGGVAEGQQGAVAEGQQGAVGMAPVDWVFDVTRLPMGGNIEFTAAESSGEQNNNSDTAAQTAVEKAEEQKETDRQARRAAKSVTVSSKSKRKVTLVSKDSKDGREETESVRDSKKYWSVARRRKLRSLTSPPPVNQVDKAAATTNQQASSSSQKKKGFGVALTQVVTMDIQLGVPEVVAQSVKFLNEHVRTEGLFRQSGDRKFVDEMRATSESGHPVRFAPNSDPHSVAALLCQFLSQLPEPLIPFEMYDKFIAAVGEFQEAGGRWLAGGLSVADGLAGCDWMSEETSKEDEQIKQLKALVKQLAAVHAKTLACVIGLCKQVVEQRTENLVDMVVLTAFMGALVLRAESWTAEKYLESEEADRVFAMLVQHKEELFA